MCLLKKLKPKELTPEEVQASLPWVIKDGVVAQLMESLTAGPIIIAFALILGASNALIGYLVSLPFLCNLAQFPGAYLVEKIRKRKLVCTIISTTGRVAFLFIALLALFPKTPGAQWILALLYTWRYFGGALAGSSWNSWMKDLVPHQILGRFFSRRLTYMILAALITTLLVAFIIDWWPFPQHIFYALLALISFGLGIYGLYIYFKIDEPPMESDPFEERFLRKFKKVFHDVNFRRLILFLGSWNFSINLAVPFFTVFILQQLQLNIGLVLILTTVTQAMNVLVMRIWGKISDSFSNKSVLLVTAPLYALCIFMFLFTGFPQAHRFTIPLLILIYTVLGIAQAGITLATGNITLKLAPKGAASVYLSVNGVVNAFMAGVAPILGGLCADSFLHSELFFTVRWQTMEGSWDFNLLYMNHWAFFFFFATILALLSLAFLKGVKEEGEAHEKIIVSSFLSMFSKTLSVSYLLPQKVFLFLSRKKLQDELTKKHKEN